MLAEILELGENKGVLGGEQWTKLNGKLRDVGEFFSNGEDNLIVLLFDKIVEEREEGVFNGVSGHESGNDGDLMNGVDSNWQIVAVEFFFEKFEGIIILHCSFDSFVLSIEIMNIY